MPDITVIQAGTPGFERLKNALADAELHGGSVSISTRNGLQVKVGGGVWSPPLDTRKPYDGPDYDTYGNPS